MYSMLLQIKATKIKASKSDNINLYSEKNKSIKYLLGKTAKKSPDILVLIFLPWINRKHSV